MDYDTLTRGFRPVFGNTNHIIAAKLIPRVTLLRERLKKIPSEKNPPVSLIKELTTLEVRVVSLLSPTAQKLPYNGTETLII